MADPYKDLRVRRGHSRWPFKNDILMCAGVPTPHAQIDSRQPVQRRKRPDENAVDCLSFPDKRNVPDGGGGGNGCSDGTRH